MTSKSAHSHHTNNQPVHGGLVWSELRALGLSSHEVIDFSVNINPLGPPPAAQEALQDLDISSYPDPECLELTEALSKATGVAMNRIVIGNGTTELIHLLIRVCAGFTDSVAVFTPTFGEYETAARHLGVNLSSLPASKYDGFTWNMDAVHRLIKTRDPDLVFLCNPNNPTGRYLTMNEVTGVAQAIGNGILVIDDSYLAFTEQPWDTAQLLSRKNVLILHSMTKEYAMAGLRLGYALCPEPVARALMTHKPSWSVNAAAQAVGIAALTDQDHLDRGRKCIDEGKAFLTSELRSRGLPVVPSSANFFLLHVDNASTFRRQLLTEGICVRDCSSFGLPDYIRVGVRTLNECKQLIAAVDHIMNRPGAASQESSCEATAGDRVQSENYM